MSTPIGLIVVTDKVPFFIELDFYAIGEFHFVTLPFFVDAYNLLTGVIFVHQTIFYNP